MTFRKDQLIKIAELLALFAILLAIDNIWLNGDAFSAVNPNPYWLPVVFMAIAFGTGPGLTAAAIASLIWVTSPHDWPDGSDLLWRQFHMSLLPLLWTITALVLGEVTASRNARIAQLKDSQSQLMADLDNVGERLVRLNRTNRELQVRIATEQHVAGQALAAAAGLVQPDSERQVDAVERMIALAVQTEDFTFYGLLGNQLIAQFRGADAANRPVDVTQAKWAQAMLSDPVPLYRSRERGRALLESDAIAAIPVVNENSGALVAALVIHHAGSLRLTSAKIAELTQVAQALGQFAARFTKPQPVDLSDQGFGEGKVA